MTVTPTTPHLITTTLAEPEPSKLQQLQQQFDTNPVLRVIQQNLPKAFSSASAEDQEAYRRALRVSKHARINLKERLKPLKGLSEFARPLLRQALDNRFGPGFEPETDTLFHPTLLASGATGFATQLTLLEAALHNFERAESVSGGFLSSASINKGSAGPHPKNIRPELFADLCRHLNIGNKYQDHLNDVLASDLSVSDSPTGAKHNTQAIFVANDQADMELYARAAYLRNDISVSAQAAVLDVLKRGANAMFNGLPVAFECIKLFGVEIPRVVIIKPQATWTFTQVPLVLYVAQDPNTPFKEFATLTELEDDLRSRLMTKAYQTFFARLLGERVRASFFSQLNRHLFKLAPMDGNWFTKGLWRNEPDHHADLRLETWPIDEELFTRMYRQQIDLIKDNARFLAVPTEDEDAKSRQARLQDWFSIGMNIANIASFLVPVLGQIMMVYATVELVGEVYHGLEEISHGDFEEGFEHLVNAGANIAFMAALATAAHGALPPEPPPITSNNFVAQVVPITLADGQVRLWKPDLEPFQSSIEVPDGASPQLSGIAEHDGKKYLTIDAQQYEVVYHKGLNKWQIKHPYPDAVFSPSLEHNGLGAFRHSWELPDQWAKDKLFRRLGHSVSGLSQTVAERILSVADVDETLLRRVHVESAAPPGQLRDTLKRFQLDASLDNAPLKASGSTRAEQFQQQYEASETSTDPLTQLVRRQFSSLPTAVIEDLAATLTPVEKQHMLDSGRIALRVSEAAAWQQRQTRLNRAFEGFYLDSVVNTDTETLSLRLLEKLPGWSDQVRLEVRQGTPLGPLLERIGNPAAAELKVLVKSNGRYQAFDAKGNELNSVPQTGNNLCGSILHALPDGARNGIGFTHVEQGVQLNLALAKLAIADRVQASRILGIRDGQLKFNRPDHMKQGRLAYSLSGRGRLPGFISDDHLLDRIGLLELDTVLAQDVLARFRAEGMSNADINARLDVLQDERQALRFSMDQWVQASSELLTPPNSLLQLDPSIGVEGSRMRIGEAILRHWQATSLPGSVADVAFRLDSIRLYDFPDNLPDFFYSSVERLQLISVSEHGPWLFRYSMPTESQMLEGFLGMFTQTTALEIRRSAFSSVTYNEVPRIVCTQLPNLRELRLIEQHLDINTEMLNRFGQMPNLETLDLSRNQSSNASLLGPIHLNLLRLRLDHIGLEQWPVWLDGLLLERMEEVSLVGNQIVGLPTELMQAVIPPRRAPVIQLQGNRLSSADMISAHLHGASANCAIRIDPGAPPELQSDISKLLREQADLEATLDEWSRASTSRVTLSDETVNTRQAFSMLLLEHWRRGVVGRSSRPLVIESMALAELPQHLPDAFYRNTHYLSLRNVVFEGDQLNQFLSRFHGLATLEVMGHTLPMSTPPRVLRTLTRLRTLALVDQGMQIDQAAMEYLSSQSNLDSLDLSGNFMGPITLSPVLERQWQTLTLDNVGISVWPEWLDSLLPSNIDVLSLANNQLTELPEEILRNRRHTSAHTEISLEGNPLSRETMIRAHIGERDHYRSFGLYMDLPEDIRAMPTERAWSSEESSNDGDSNTDSDSDASNHSHGSTGAEAAAPANIDQWLEGTPQERLDQQAVWDQIEAAGDAPMLMALIGRLRETADYMRAREALGQRVWHVLGAAAKDSHLRQLLNAIAQEAIASRTCGDGVRLEFNQMEVQVFALDSLRDIEPLERGPTLYRLTRRFFRLDEVDRLARENAAGRDQAEVRLAYRLKLAESLDLPLPPARMLYRTAAAVTADELQNVEGLVLTSQNSPAFYTHAVSRDFWVEWLREAYASEFTELSATFESERARVEDDFPELDDAYLARIEALAAEQKKREAQLIEQLTYREGMKYGD